MRWPARIAGAILGLGLSALPAVAAAEAVHTPLSRSLEDAGFERVSARRGVRAYQHRTDALVHIAGEGELEAPPERVRALLLDYGRHAGRMPRLRDSRVVKRTTDALVVYQRLALPIIDDRDFVLRVRWGARGPDLWIAYEAAPHEGPPPVDGVVRVSLHGGTWQLRPLRNGTATFARYQARLDVAGSVPKWMARSGAGKDVVQLFVTVRRLLRAER